jgi:hypothetical protein
LVTVANAYSGEVAKMAADIIAEGQSDPAVLKLFNDRFVSPRRTQAKLVIEAGIAAGEIDPSIDPDLALDVLFAPIYFRLLVRHAPLDDAFIKGLPKMVLNTLKPKDSRKSRRVLMRG